MSEQLSPEQRAHEACVFLNLPDGGIARRVITAAIRAAETAAVEAERARCAKEIEAVVNGEGPLWQRPVADPRGDREPDSADVLDRLPEYIRRTPTTEADTHG